MDKVVVIGGSGFMGSHTADELTKRGYAVSIYDRCSSPWLLDQQQMFVGDMLDRNALIQCCKDARYIFHFGGIADIQESLDQPLETIQTNIMGTTIALEAAIEVGVERFLYASTLYVYSPFGSFYRATKQAAEILIEAYHEKFGLSYTLLRYGSLYGPRAQEWNGLKQYVTQIVCKGKLEYAGTGRERREYIHVEDAARLTVDDLNSPNSNHAVTVSGSQALSSSELIEMIFEIAGVARNVSYSKAESKNEHYEMTPYRYTPKTAKKIVPSEYIDIGQGILDLVAQINQENESKASD